MLSFKLFCKLMEDFEGSGQLGIYKNPTKEELKKIPPFARGFISKNSDLFVANTIKGANSLHFNMITRGKNLFPGEFQTAEMFSPKMLTLQRIEDSNLFVPGESEADRDPDGRRPTLNLSLSSKQKQLAKNVRKKLPHIRFNLNATPATFPSFVNFSIFTEKYLKDK